MEPQSIWVDRGSTVTYIRAWVTTRTTLFRYPTAKRVNKKPTFYCQREAGGGKSV